MSAITATAIGLRIKDALVASSAISAACVSAFGQGTRQKVFFGPPLQQAPTIADCPVFNVTPIGKTHGESIPDRSWRVRVALFITQDDPTTGTYEDTFTGWTDLETILDLAIVAARGISATISLDSAEIALGDFDEFPVLGGSVMLTFSAPVLLGATVEL